MMAQIERNWRSPEGIYNSNQLRAHYVDVFASIADIDALGHRVLKRASDSTAADNLDKVVGLSLLRRAITQFVGIRHLLESSSVQPAIIVARALYETFLSTRYLVHGGKRYPRLETKSSSRGREVRARYYFAASLRRGICRRQAILDGAEGTKRVRKADERRALEDEVRREVERLNRYYPSQQRRFGPLPCFPKGNKKPRYYDTRKWFSFGFRKENINSFKALARRLGSVDLYFLFYSPASRLGHAQGTGHDGAIGDGHMEIYSPYKADGFEFVAFWACSWQGLIVAHFCKAYHPESFADARKIATQSQVAFSKIEAAVPEGFY